MNTAIPRAEQQLRSQVAEQSLARGVVLYASLEGEPVAEVAVGVDGAGQAVASDSLFALYCGTKPIVSIGAARLVDSGRLSLQAPISDYLEGTRGTQLGAVTVREVLTHTGGLHVRSAVEMSFLTPDRRLGAVIRDVVPRGWKARTQAAYSEFAGWWILGEVLSRASSRPLSDFLRAEVLRPIELEDSVFVGMTSSEFEQNYRRIAVNLDLRNLDPVPMLMERTERTCTECNPAFGAYGTAQGLGRFYETLLRVLSGKEQGVVSREVLEEFVTPQRTGRFDLTLDRFCDFGLGFMVNLSGHEFGERVSPSAFGHTGAAGTLLSFADPKSGLVVAAVHVGMIDARAAVDYRRPALVDLVHKDLGL